MDLAQLDDNYRQLLRDIAERCAWDNKYRAMYAQFERAQQEIKAGRKVCLEFTPTLREDADHIYEAIGAALDLLPEPEPVTPDAADPPRRPRRQPLPVRG